jgi:putative transposase
MVPAYVHLVFVTKYRRCSFDGEAFGQLRHIFSKVCTDFEAQWKNVLSSPSYFAASCGGAPLGVIQRYVEEQATPLEGFKRTLYPRPKIRSFTDRMR